MAYVHLNITNYSRTALQNKLLSLINDDSVRIEVNNRIVSAMYHLVPLNSSAFPSHNHVSLEDGGDSSGRLRQSVKVEPTEIIYRTPYARYVYHGVGYGPHIPIHAKGSKQVIGFYSTPAQSPVGNMKYSTEGTGPYWYKKLMDDPAKTRRMNVSITAYLKAECRRRNL